MADQPLSRTKLGQPDVLPDTAQVHLEVKACNGWTTMVPVYTVKRRRANSR